MKVQRIHEVERYVRKHGSASLDELCRVFNVSKNTIRRDTNVLIEKGYVEKVYGGVVIKEDKLVPFEHRQIANQKEKQKISQKAASLIEAGDMIYVDSGTTTKALLEYVAPDLNFTVVTNNLDVMVAAAGLEHVQLIVVGSRYKRKTRSFVDLQNDQLASEFNITKAFMAATGLTIPNGLTNSDMLETHIKKIVCQKANQLYLMVDDSKFNHATLITYAPLSKVDCVISGGDIKEEYLTYFKEHDIVYHKAY